ncbi:MAG: GtrA family protein [Actinomycetota bacterium]|nr:GtrA family protein [Actinomycetota bacterium]
MRALIVRAFHLWEKRDTPEARKLFKYTMVSVVSTAVSFAVLAISYGVLRAGTEVQCTVFANVVATVPSYYLNRNWAWGKGGKSHLTKEIIPFWAMSAAGIVVSMGGAAIAHQIGVDYHLSHVIQTGVVLAANVLSFGIFWVLKYLLFNRLFRVHPLEELDELVEAA